jgi:hypothetical protein
MKDLIARFDINENFGMPLDGRAYVSSCHFDTAYNSNLLNVIKKFREIIRSKELETARNKRYIHVIALIWAEHLLDNQFDQMIDFFAWGPGESHKDLDISSWKIKNGMLVTASSGILQITSEAGIDILKAERDHRVLVSNE